MPVTLQQIATRAGVTRSQVSRVLNGRYKENRPAIARRAENIRAIAAELGYRPNLAARSVSEGRFGQMGFVTCGDLGFDWFAPALLHGIHRRLDAAGQRLVVHELSGERMTDEADIPRLFQQSAIDAMLVNLDSKLPHSVLERFDAQPVPTVLLNQKRNTRAVHPDERAAGGIAVRHLLDLGRQRIGFVCLHRSRAGAHFSRVDRFEGAADAASDAGAAALTRLDGAAGYRPAGGNGPALLAGFLEANPRLDAVVCYSLPEASALLLAAAARGLRVPENLSVVVFSDKVAHAATGIPIDTLIVPFRDVGEAAVEMADAMITGGGDRRPGARVVPYRRFYHADRDAVVDLLPPEPR